MRDDAERLTFRLASAEDVETCANIERACFPDAEAAPRSSIAKRQAQYADGFLLAELDGRTIGFINSGATHELDIADEAFKDMVGHDPQGSELVIFSVTIVPELQGQGLSSPLVRHFVEHARTLGKQRVHLLCKASLLSYYARFGFVDCGQSESEHGGASWHAMTLKLD